MTVFALQSRRDSGSSLLAERSGRMEARPALSTSFALAWRLQWPTIMGWCVGAAATGVLAGSLAKLVEQAAQTNAILGQTLRTMVAAGETSISQVLIAAMFAIVGVLAAACAVQTVVRMRQEEDSRRAELVLSTTVSRVHWLADYLLLGVVSVVLVLLTAALFASLAVLVSGDSPERMGDVFLAAAAQLPAALLYLGVVALLFVVVPGASTVLGWAFLGSGVFLGIFGGMIGAPEALRNLSPFTHTPVPQGIHTNVGGGVWMVGLAVVVAAAAVVGMRRRDLHTG
ncbi:hypothetical protein [Pseudarthrobacter sp. J1763]|uniref:hypothetical protein n=1 Tax=Pseudarthrobacter sp. J1763 TaxID=3420445 RepID=UPI003D2D2360